MRKERCNPRFPMFAAADMESPMYPKSTAAGTRHVLSRTTVRACRRLFTAACILARLARRFPFGRPA